MTWALEGKAAIEKRQLVSPDAYFASLPAVGPEGFGILALPFVGFFSWARMEMKNCQWMPFSLLVSRNPEPYP